MKSCFILLAALMAAWTVNAQPPVEKNLTPDSMQTIDYLNIPLETITGDTTTLAQYHGQVLLLINVASKCGNTPQYKGLEALYRRFKPQGFTIIGFPANNFGGQEPGTDGEILAFCQHTYDVTFPLMSKLSVKGKNQHPLYTYLTKQSTAPGEITWNFEKFLLDRTGHVAARFTPKTQPDDPRLITEIESLLAQPR